MAKSLIEHLFSGEIYPSEIIGVSNTKLNELNAAARDAMDMFLENLSKQDQEAFEKADDKRLDANSVYHFECFSHGFKLGMLILFEALADRHTLIHKDYRNKKD